MNQTVRIYGELKDELTSRKFAFKPVFDGNLFRFDRNGKIGSAWAVGKTATSAGKPIQMLMFGDFATGESYEWWSRKALTKEEAKDLAASAAEERKKYQQAKKAKQKEAAKEVFSFWGGLQSGSGLSQYGLRKGLYELYGAKLDGEDLYVPIHTANGTLCNLQRIEADGTKRFWPGGAIRGNAFFVNGYPEKAPSTIYLAEGYSTGASIFEALRSRPSAALATNQDGAELGNSPTSIGGGDQTRRQPLSDASGMAQNAADNPTKDGGVSQAPRSYRCGNKDTDTAPRARSQGKRPTRADHRTRLEHQLLTALASTDAKRKQDERARSGGSQGLHTLQSTQGDASLEVESTLRGDGRSRLSRSGQSAGRDGPYLNGLAQPAAIELPAIHDGQPGDDQRGDAALPGGVGANSWGKLLDHYYTEPRSTRDEQRGSASLSPEGCAIVQGLTSGIGRGIEAHGPTLNGDSDEKLALLQGRGSSKELRDMQGGEDRGSGTPLKDGGTSGLRGSHEENFIVVCALNAGNLNPVAQALRKRYPTARVIVCGDDDRHTTKPDGSAWNPGREAALEAARSVGGLVSFPQFDRLECVSAATDFNDLSLLPNGPARVLASLEAAQTPEDFDVISTAAAARSEIAKVGKIRQESAKGESSLLSFDKHGKPILPTSRQMANYLLEKFDGLIVKQDRDLFLYKGTHWRHLDQHGIDDLAVLVQDICEGLGTTSQIDEYIETLRRVTPSIPPGRNLFMSDTWLANFQNGTLHAVRNCTKYYLEFRSHNRLDYAINVLPYEYRSPAELPTNERFEQMLRDVFEGDDDWAQKRRAVAQMFGACLLPMTPHLFMLWGQAGTGKSSLIKLAARLVHRDNSCSVDPCDFDGFNMEVMAGKLVNWVTDINTKKHINDAIVKQIEDRVEMTIRRKNRLDLRAPLPSIHLFGGNAVPPTLEGASGAHERRWTFIQFKKVFVTGFEDKFFSEKVFDECPNGILKFALEGLQDLVESQGHFVQPDSGKEKMRNWQLENDPIGSFIAAIKDGEVLDGNTVLKSSNDCEILRSKLYDVFKSFLVNSAPEQRVIPALKFYSRLEEMGFRLKKVHGSRFIQGLGVGVGTGAHC